MKPIYLEGDLRRPGDYRGSNPPPASVGRSPYTHDTASEYGRIVHSMAFRRLQGKMQLFPPNESPLLRNRLTHTLEVADIATNIAKALNDKSASKEYLIDGAFVATAALAHDLGHPPFGHSGELVLNRCMKGHGGFEGNAQSLRILTRLENRFVEEFPRTLSYKEVYRDPLGLNLLHRTIAATIKYDVMVPSNSDSPTPVKGYYQEDKYIVESVKRHVLGDYSQHLKLRTIENQIMDIADDVAYSTYDLEDCMICGVVNPVDLMAIEDHVAVAIRDKVNGKLKFYGYNYDLDEREIITILYKLFDDISRPNYPGRYNWDSATDRTAYVGFTYKEAKSFGINPLYRRRLTETLIRHAVNGMTIESWNENIPCLTKLHVKTSAVLFIEVLKAYNYIMVIQSPRLQIYQKRACDIVYKLFTVLYEDDENTMLPLTAREQLDYQLNGGNEYFDDATRTFKAKAPEDILSPEEKRRRFICDYIASLTDAEAIDLYAKITSSDQRTIFGVG